jgi:excisionase family DNA binding protein
MGMGYVDLKREWDGVTQRADSAPAIPGSTALLLTVAEAATLSGFSNRAIYRAISRGELRVVRVCSRLRIPRGWFDEWIKRSLVRPENPIVVPPPTPAPAPGSFRALMRQSQDGRSK